MESPTALVTGASRGIGRGVAVALGQLGWRVVINYHRNANAAVETQQLIEEEGGQGVIVQADVADHEDQKKLVQAALTEGGRIDLLVNNAGVAPAQRLDLLEATEESYHRVMDINLKGPYFLTQRVARVMIDLLQSGILHRPKIINIGSISAYASSPGRGEYCLSKAAMGMMTILFADRLAEYGINVYEIRPGIIATDMTDPVREKYDRLIADGLTPIRRWGRPEDVGRAVVAIVKDLLPFSTGEVINVDGGFHLRRL